MKPLLCICAVILFIGVADLPIGYYTFLRIVISIGAGIVCYQEWENPSKNWLIIFGAILILFNPVMPVYLNNKALWIPLDIITGIIFVVKALSYKKSEKEDN
ncbi:MAG: DUF6804 family protein [Dysgonomonas sp.]|nr:DUF6804 family protein [Dysgonomonas sp.]